MTASLAPTDPETLTFEATVERGGESIVLSETYFYPEGGGQPADRGTLGDYEVVDVRSESGSVIHTIDGHLHAGATVSGEIDAAFRRYCMRAHTASHALYGAGRKLFEELGYGGFDIGWKKVRVDFETPTEIDDGTLVELERQVNRCVWDSRDVRWERLPRDEALGRRDVAFNTKTEEGITGETVRIVEIDDWDAAACGGTHVSNTREIGPVTVLGRSNPGEGLTRVEFSVGPSSIRRRALEKRAAFEAADAIGTNVESLPEEVERIRKERESIAKERDELRSELFDRRIDSIVADAFDRAGHRWAAGTVEVGSDANALAEAVRERPEGIDVLVLATPAGQLAVGAGPTDADQIVDELIGTFGGGGGGTSDIAQGGGLDVDGATVVDHLRDRR